MKLKKWLCLEDCIADYSDEVVLFKKGKIYKQVCVAWDGAKDEYGDNRGFGKLKNHFKELTE